MCLEQQTPTPPILTKASVKWNKLEKRVNSDILAGDKDAWRQKRQKNLGSNYDSLKINSVFVSACSNALGEVGF